MIIHTSGIHVIYRCIFGISHGMMRSKQMSRPVQQIKPHMGKVLPVH